MKKIFKIFATSSLLFLASCGFHLRTPADFPTGLQVLFFESDNVYNAISEELKRQLSGMQVHFTASRSEAPFTLKLADSHFTATMPVAFAGSSATTYSYQLTVNVLLITRNNQVLFNTVMTASQALTFNVNQTGTPAPPQSIRNALVQQVVMSIYDLLTSVSAQQLIQANLMPKTVLRQ